MIIDHNSPLYRSRWNNLRNNRYNGAFFYSKEIVKNIIPRVKTDRNWITVNVPGYYLNHSIFFAHNNLHPENYERLRRWEDIVIVCGIPETVERVGHLGQAIYLPLSIDVADVMQYKCEKTKYRAYIGRADKRQGVSFPHGTDFIEGLPRTKLLAEMAKYKYVYAVGRTAIEARALGCEILPFDPRFPDPSRWQVLDNREAAILLQKELDRIDSKRD